MRELDVVLLVPLHVVFLVSPAWKWTFYDTERERNCDFQFSHLHGWFPIPLGEPEIESKVCHCRLFEKCKVRWSGYSGSTSLSRINGV